MAPAAAGRSSSDPPLLVVVTGPPAAGKTTTARTIAAGLELPLLTKDTIKEALFDGLGTGDVAWSKRLGEATFLVLFALVEESLRGGASLVVEANFVHGQSESAFRRLRARIVQVHCSAPSEVLVERYRARRRHPGHVDGERLEDVRRAIETGRHAPLDLDGETIRLDTGEVVEVAPVVERLRALRRPRAR